MIISLVNKKIKGEQITPYFETLRASLHGILEYEIYIRNDSKSLNFKSYFTIDYYLIQTNNLRMI